MNWAVRLLGLSALSAAAVLAQESPLPDNAISINLPKGSPVERVGLDKRDSRISSRGSAIMVDLDALLTLRNTSTNRIHGMTLRVVTQESAIGGKAWMGITPLNIGPGEYFPVHIVQKLMRPGAVPGPLVEVTVDGVLFQDLSFVGPDQLHMRRDLVAWEMEAQRDRNYFKQILGRSGPKGLQTAMLKEMERMQERPQLDRPQIRRGPSVTSAAAPLAEQSQKLAFVAFNDSPVEVVSGSAAVSGGQVSAPHIEVRNRSAVPVKFVEVGWLVEDQAGQSYLAATVPSSQDDLGLGAGKTAAFSQDTSMKLSHNGQPLKIRGMRAYISRVEFADHKVWIPSRKNLDDPALRNVLPPSPEVVRLSEIYRNGLDQLVAELNKE
jgi:hypothetical protein